ncbi:MAG: 2-C-methyl-D-erythritol 4-phosphate cytidylyltransferase [Lentisphaeria bacterium]|nr:2-C-methyl-D-erythritol 4-phosphate cytidylyltransferase [Lentisphaeria bacterium]
MKKYAVILAGGIGSRMNTTVPKQLLEIDGVPILAYSLRKFEEHPQIDGIVLVMHGDYIHEGERIAGELNLQKLLKIIPGGSSRKQSSFNGVAALPEEESFVLIHDAARPFVSDRIISDCCNILETCRAASTVIESSDTVYILEDNGVVNEIPDRSKVVMVQTPQCFHYSVIAEAHRLGAEDPELNFTDDSGMVHHYGLAEVRCVRGELANRKITNPGDLL